MSYSFNHTAPLFTVTVIHDDPAIASGHSDRAPSILRAINGIPSPDWPPDKINMTDLGGNVWRFKIEWPAAKVFNTKIYLTSQNFMVQEGSVKDLTNGEIEGAQALRAILVDMALGGTLIDLDFDRLP